MFFILLAFVILTVAQTYWNFPYPRAKTALFMVLPAVVGLFLFVINFSSWTNLFCILLIFWLINFFNHVTLHRWLTHEQFEPRSLVRPVLLYSLTLVGNIRPLDWVQAHKSHHFFPDTKFDPYPPSLGLWTLLTGVMQWPKGIKLRFTTELHKKDIQFVHKYYFWIYIVNLVLFFLIDPNIVFLSFVFLKFYSLVIGACMNWILHGSSLHGKPTNVSAFYNCICYGDNMHENHHKNPSVFYFDFAQRHNWFYFLLQFFVKKKQ